MSSEHYSTTMLTSWAVVKEKLSGLGDAWIFRGQRDSRWELASFLDRSSGSTPGDIAEKIVSRIFRRKAHHYLNMQEVPVDDMEWLALMQHHGAPTRFLDWTKSNHMTLVHAYWRIPHLTGPSANVSVPIFCGLI